MEAIKNALAALVAAEARYHELLDPETEIGNRTRAVVKECAAALLDLHALVHQIAHAPAVESDVNATPAPLPITVSTGPEGLAHLEGEQVQVVEDGNT